MVTNTHHGQSASEMPSDYTDLLGSQPTPIAAEDLEFVLTSFGSPPPKPTVAYAPTFPEAYASTSKPAVSSSVPGIVPTTGNPTSGGQSSDVILVDEKDMMWCVVQNQHLKLVRRYRAVKDIGHGAYGVVFAAWDYKLNEKVAIKHISNAFQDPIDAKRVLRECKLLRHFDHPNIISVLDLTLPSSLSKFRDVCIVTDLMETDLYEVINSKQSLGDEHVQYFIYQVLCALKHIHSAGVVHRDLKPQNLLVNANCDLKVCDFGLARTIEEEDRLTEYVVTRWYRAPEVLLSPGKYNKELDVWSVGCIMAELFLRSPVFPGADYMDMVKMICQGLGKPSEDDLTFVTSRAGRRFVEKIDYTGTEACRLVERLKRRNVNPVGVDLLRKMLQLHPRKRITVDEALMHPYLVDYHDLDEADMLAEPFVFDEEPYDLTKPMLKELMFREIAHYHTTAKKVVLKAAEDGRLFFPLKADEFDI